MKLLQMLSKCVQGKYTNKINETKPLRATSPETSARSAAPLPPLLLQRSRFGPKFIISRSRCIEARSAHNLRASLAIGVCAKSMLRERRCSLWRPWLTIACLQVRERRRPWRYAAALRCFQQLVLLFGWMSIFVRHFSCAVLLLFSFKST